MGRAISIPPLGLYASVGTASAPLMLDVRRTPAFDTDERLIVGALRRDPEGVAEWQREMPRNRPVVVYCMRGHEVSQNVAAALRACDIDARYLEGVITGWAELNLPRRKKRSAGEYGWITRERPKIDRIACPWLIRRFIDPGAEFLYVPAHRVLEVASEQGATPYDIPDVEFSHVGELCSFDAFLARYQLDDAALRQLAVIVRGADTSRLDLTPQSAGLFAISLGLSACHADDHEMLAHGMVMYDALYAWCQSCQQEQHSWPPDMR